MSLGDLEQFSRHVIRRPLYPYQVEAATGITPYIGTNRLDSPTFTVEMARQGGKNELSAHLECWLLNRYQNVGGQIVKAAPTFKPQVVNSIERLKSTMDNWWNRGRWKAHFVYIIRLGRARVLFFSTDKQANVVGATASLMLEVDEAQDVDEIKFTKDFLPMAAVNNAVQIDYGTAWTSNTVLEKRKSRNLDLQKKDGIRRVYVYPWEAIAEQNPQYGTFVRSEIKRLGNDHPIIKTQFRLVTIDESGTFLSDVQIEQMRGDHPRQKKPGDYSTEGEEFEYVAGIDFAGESETEKDELLRSVNPRKDSTVVTIARLDWSDATDDWPYPQIQIVDHYWWTGHNHASQYQGILRLVDSTWDCQSVVCDNTGVGAGVTSFLRDRLGDRIIPYDFNEATKSKLGFEFLAAVNTNRLKMYSELKASPEAKEFWKEMGLAQQEVSRMKRIRFFVPEEEGHDDFLMSTALTTWAARYVPFPGTSEQKEDFFPRGRR